MTDVIRHVAMFRWVEGTTPQQVAAATEALRALPEQVPTIRAYVVGSDLELGEGRWDFAVTGDFGDVEGYQAYAEHPAHLAVIAEHMKSIIGERATVQIEI